MRAIHVLATALLLAVAGHAQSAAKPASGRKPVVVPGSERDLQIEKAIRTRFLKSKINADHFEVRVQNGVATLTGKTDIIQHKGTATRLARVAGADRVQNRIEISEGARQKAAQSLEKSRKRAEVKQVPTGAPR